MSIFLNLRSSSYHLACADFSPSSLLSSYWTCGQFSKYWDVTTGFYAFSDIPKSLEIFNGNSIPILLPTKFLRTSSTWHKTPTKSSHTRGCTEVSEPLRNECRWHSDLYSVRGNANLFPQCINIPHCRHFATGLKSIPLCPCLLCTRQLEMLYALVPCVASTQTTLPSAKFLAVTNWVVYIV